MPPMPNAATVMGVQGPLGRSAEDLELALSVLAGPDVGEDVAWRVELPSPRHGRLADFRVAVLPPIPWLPVDAEIAGALDDLSSRLGRLGCTIAQAQPEGLGDHREHHCLYRSLLSAVTGARVDEEGRRQRIAMWRKADDESPGPPARARGGTGRLHPVARPARGLSRRLACLFPRMGCAAGARDQRTRVRAHRPRLAHRRQRPHLDLHDQWPLRPLPARPCVSGCLDGGGTAGHCISGWYIAGGVAGRSAGYWPLSRGSDAHPFCRPARPGDRRLSQARRVSTCWTDKSPIAADDRPLSSAQAPSTEARSAPGVQQGRFIVLPPCRSIRCPRSAVRQGASRWDSPTTAELLPLTTIRRPSGKVCVTTGISRGRTSSSSIACHQRHRTMPPLSPIFSVEGSTSSSLGPLRRWWRLRRLPAQSRSWASVVTRWLGPGGEPGEAGWNLTGLAILTDEIELKNLQLLKELAPRVTRVAVLWNPDNPVWTSALKRLQQSAPMLGVKLQPLAVRGGGDLEAAFATATREKVDATPGVPRRALHQYAPADR